MKLPIKKKGPDHVASARVPKEEFDLLREAGVDIAEVIRAAIRSAARTVKRKNEKETEVL
jgi:predicted Fe-Mo cluster-binding NifX family protein